MRQRISSGTSSETLAGYSRALRVGPFIYISGTTATDEHDAVVGAGDAYVQTVYAIEKIERALKAAGATLDHVVRTRIFLADVSQWEAVSRAHAEFFAERRPANTLVEISALVGEGYLVEIEADAVIDEALGV